MSELRIGSGYDTHPLVAGRALVLGGIEIPYEKGLDGWSDADVLCHALMDALLGAATLGDIGSHFPPGDERYRDASSLGLLAETVLKIKGHGFSVVNVDATVVAEAPRLAGYVPAMRETLSRTLDVPSGRVSVKASTANGLGYIGRGAGMAAYAVVLIEGGEDEGI